jgi:hypothetical protein
MPPCGCQAREEDPGAGKDPVTVLIPGFILTAVLAAVVMQACCGPNTCPQARSGASVLAKAVAEIEGYKERNGRYPVRLDDIKPRFALDLELELKRSCPDCSGLTYRTDSFGYEMEYLYPHMGKNRCVHNNEMERWDCKGIY